MHKAVRPIVATCQQCIADLGDARKRLLQQHDPEALHDLRVGIRRLRSTLLPFQHLPAMRPLRRTLKCFKQLAEATNTIRDREVQLGLIKQYGRNMDGMADWITQQQHCIQREQHALLERPQDVPWKKLRRKLKQRLVAGLQRNDKNVVETMPAHTKEALLHKLQLAVNDPALFDDTNHWHRARLDCKRLRYLMESYGQVIGGGDNDVLIKAVKAAQESLGALHDWEVLLASLASGGVATATDWLSEQYALRKQAAQADVATLRQRLPALAAQPPI